MNIGKFNAERQAPSSHHSNCLEIAVSKQYENNNRLRVSLQLLSVQQISLVRQGKLSPLINKGSYIVEMFFAEKDSQIYLASVIDDRTKKVSTCLNNICFSPEICLRLMAEAVLLLKELQAAGIIINEPLKNFIQL